MKISSHINLITLALAASFCGLAAQPYVRVNQVGYLPGDKKIAVVLSETDLADEEYTIVERATHQVAYVGPLWNSQHPYGKFRFVYTANFSSLTAENSYAIKVGGSDSTFFRIGESVYDTYADSPLNALAQLRCGYNPAYDSTCHRSDGVMVDLPDSNRAVDVTGGYHDGARFEKSMLTTSSAIGTLLVTFKEYPNRWNDAYDERRKEHPNNVPDILDEARWGLEWMLKMTAIKGTVLHQVGDDRSAAIGGFPFADTTDYGWGRGRNRPVYAATGAPQGIGPEKNGSSGCSNIAGRTSAVFALASWIWKNQNLDLAFAEALNRKAVELYDLSRYKLGSTESVTRNPALRIVERTYYDDLEWAATELYRSTGQTSYLGEAMNYANLAADTTWMGRDDIGFDEVYPLVNLAHYELYDFVSREFKETLRQYYARPMKQLKAAAGRNAFGFSVPLVRGSNYLAAAFITQSILYKKMSGSSEFDALANDARDWLFGRNPWGVRFAFAVPRLPVAGSQALLMPGGFAQGPVRKEVFDAERVQVASTDGLEQFQSRWVYHNDPADFITNGLSTDGTASLLFMLTHFSKRGR